MAESHGIKRALLKSLGTSGSPVGFHYLRRTSGWNQQRGRRQRFSPMLSLRFEAKVNTPVFNFPGSYNWRSREQTAPVQSGGTFRSPTRCRLAPRNHHVLMCGFFSAISQQWLNCLPSNSKKLSSGRKHSHHCWFHVESTDVNIYWRLLPLFAPIRLVHCARQSKPSTHYYPTHHATAAGGRKFVGWHCVKISVFLKIANFLTPRI